MAASAIERIRSAASGAVVIRTAIGARAARTAGPVRVTSKEASPQASAGKAAPTPAVVAKIIAPHPSEGPKPAATPHPRAKKSVPGAKLPVKRPDSDTAG